MSTEHTTDHPHTRREFVGGATAAGVGALAASSLPEAAAAASKKRGRRRRKSEIKLTCVIRRREDLSAEEFHRYWLKKHGPFARRQLKSLGARRYVQSHTLDTPLNAALAAMRGTAEAFDGIVEVWFDSLDALVAASSSKKGQRANEALAQDEKKFIDLPRSSFFLTKEHVIIGEA
jgi:uncharacterized protein (TIGR02118 family)